MPRIKTKADDFEVEELPLYDPTGTGETTLVLARKRDLDTRDVVRRFAEALDVDPSRVGYAGRKDRHAVALQWFSVPGWREAVGPLLSSEGVEIVETHRHDSRLRPGDLRGNRFRIRVREVDEAERDLALERLREIEAAGLTNRFGRQRFGATGGNAAQGRRVLTGQAGHRDRRHARFLISALQAELFNEAIARRPVPVSRLLHGDLVFDHRRGRTRPVTDLDADQALADVLGVSPTGPLYGSKMRHPRGEVARQERELWQEQGLPEWRRSPLPRHLLPAGGRRPMRVPVEEVHGDCRDGDLALEFVLPPGSYATVLVEALFDRSVDEGPGA